jgi:predicted transcriptional regulator
VPVLFTDRELDIMAVLWDRGSSTVAEVRARLKDVLNHNTVATMLTILETKGYVTHSEDGRAFRYHPTVGREEAGRSALGRLVEKVFAGSSAALVTQFVDDRRLSRAELERIRTLLDARLGPVPRRARPKKGGTR